MRMWTIDWELMKLRRKEVMIDIQERLKQRQALAAYTRLMNLCEVRLQDIEKNPGPHIKCLSNEVARLRLFLQRVDHILYPAPTKIEGCVQYPEAVDIGAEAVKKLNDIILLMRTYRHGKPCRPEEEADG